MTTACGALPVCGALPPPLPSLVLPPRQLRKVEMACKKWLTRFLLTLATAAASGSAAAGSRNGEVEGGAGAAEAPDVGSVAARVCRASPAATGFVVLNGGLLAGCTPYDLRSALVEAGVLRGSPCATLHDTVLEYSSTLPFVLCSRPIVEGDGAGLVGLTVPEAELRRYAAQPHASGDEGSASCSTVADTTTSAAASVSEGCGLSVAVLQLPPSTALWRGSGSSAVSSLSTSASSSSSANRGSGFLFLLPCDVATVRSTVGHLFRRPVVGVESLFAMHMSDGSGEEAGAAAVVAASDCPRLCRARCVPAIPGLVLVEDFVTREEEAAIWRELHNHRDALRLEFLSRRRVAHFNRRFLYGLNQLSDAGAEVNARPSFYDWMQARLQNDDPTRSVRLVGDFPLGPGDYPCDQLTVNYYDYSEMGACGIAAHVDTHRAVDDTILVVSLGSYTVMEFTRWDAVGGDVVAGAAATCGVYLPPRSLLLMSGEARYGWTHCIAEKRTDTVSELLPTLTRGDRLSLTWRRGRTGQHLKAECPFPTLCDGE